LKRLFAASPNAALGVCVRGGCMSMVVLSCARV